MKKKTIRKQTDKNQPFTEHEFLTYAAELEASTKIWLKYFHELTVKVSNLVLQQGTSKRHYTSAMKKYLKSKKESTPLPSNLIEKERKITIPWSSKKKGK